MSVAIAKRICVLAFVSSSLLLFFPDTTFAQQQQGYTQESLFIALFSDGNAFVEYDIRVTDPDALDTEVALFGETITDLIVVDYEDNLIEFQQGDVPNEIVISGVTNGTNVRISYESADFVSKDRRTWTFALDDAPAGFSVKLPLDNFVIDYGEPPPSIKHIGGQTILIFDQGGDVKISYIIGFLGTEDQANAAIKFAEITIRDMQENRPDIVLTEANDLLDRANDAKTDERFADAEKLGLQATDAAIATEKDYLAAQSIIASSEQQVQTAIESNMDVSKAEPLLAQARAEFTEGSYIDARSSATQATAAITEKVDNSPFIIMVAGIGAAVAAGAGGAAYYFRKKQAGQQVRPVPSRYREREEREKVGQAEIVPQNIDPRLEDIDHHPTAPEPVLDSPEQQKENKITPGLPLSASHNSSIANPVEQSQLSTTTPTIPDSQIDKSLLSRIVQRIIVEKTNLRPEDQEVLRFLAENEGAAFESELRNRFQLPKTTIWRLVKRLEREELIEVRKAGGQNLIKLRFEDKQP